MIDQNAPIHEEFDSEWEKELVNAVKAKNMDESEILEVEDEDDTEHNPEQPTLSHKEALQMVEQLKTFSLRNDIHEAFAMFQDAQEVIEKEAIQLMSKAKQTSIDQYFTPTKKSPATKLHSLVTLVRSYIMIVMIVDMLVVF